MTGYFLTVYNTTLSIANTQVYFNRTDFSILSGVLFPHLALFGDSVLVLTNSNSTLGIYMYENSSVYASNSTFGPPPANQQWTISEETFAVFADLGFHYWAYNLSTRLVNTSGEPLSGAVLYAYHVGNETLVVSPTLLATTDQYGISTLLLPANGTYALEVSYYGMRYDTNVSSITLSNHTVLTVQISLGHATQHVFTVDEEGYPITTYSNSLITDFTLNQAQKTINLTVTGESGTSGYCNITFPTPLLSGPYILLVDGTQVTPIDTSNATHTNLYCTYTHSVHTIEIIGTTVIPEFPTMMLTAILLVIMSLTLFFVKWKSVTQPQHMNT